jgi:hypothetical protein
MYINSLWEKYTAIAINLERHPTDSRYERETDGYSVDPEQISNWLTQFQEDRDSCSDATWLPVILVIIKLERHLTSDLSARPATVVPNLKRHPFHSNSEKQTTMIMNLERHPTDYVSERQRRLLWCTWTDIQLAPLKKDGYIVIHVNRHPTDSLLETD